MASAAEAAHSGGLASNGGRGHGVPLTKALLSVDPSHRQPERHFLCLHLPQGFSFCIWEDEPLSCHF